MSARTSVVIPTLNEAPDIVNCLELLAAQTVGAESLQIVLADGCSVDGTVEVAAQAASRLGFDDFVAVENPARRTSAGLNRALAVAGGEYVVRIDARSRVDARYIELSTAVLQKDPRVGVVGGAQIAIARDVRAVSRGIARALRNRYTTGLSRYRTARESGPTDTVWMGVFRRQDLLRLGGWNEAVALNEDFDLNERYRCDGKVVWFEADLRSGYLPRRNLRLLAQQYFRFGRVKGTWWARGQRPNRRQLVLLAVPVVGSVVARVVSRRRGPLAAVASAFVVIGTADHVGAGEKGDVLERIISSSAIALYCSSWYSGVVTGYIGERIGLRHDHG